MSRSYLLSRCKYNCYGCEACVQSCPLKAIEMVEDEHMFRYPNIDKAKCIGCGKCQEVCPVDNVPKNSHIPQKVFGGYNREKSIRLDSTSGGAFSAIVDLWCIEKYAIFGAKSDGLEVYHSYCVDKNNSYEYRKSKYLQSKIDGMYEEVRNKLYDGFKVLFSGTPCQVAGLLNYLGDYNIDNLLTVEVVCEGVPSPLYINKYNEWCKKKYGSRITYLDYRYTDKNKWDFQVMKTVLENREKKIDRWFNPFWSIWLNHLMSRPSCYSCPFANLNRVSDITLGDLWGVHLYCPDLYGKNGGSSLVLANTNKGVKIIEELPKFMYGHELDLEMAVQYQSPLRNHIKYNDDYTEFMNDLVSNMNFKELNKKWAKRPTIRLILQKYVWGNRQKIAMWKVKQRINTIFHEMLKSN